MQTVNIKNLPKESPFNKDIVSNQGYRYTTHAMFSSRLANERQTEMTLAALDFRQKKVLDIGCGDGTYTVELFDRGNPDCIEGVDLAEEAIKLAQQKTGNRRIAFRSYEGERFPFADRAFDIAHLRGVLHHADKPLEVMREALRVAPTIIIIEPNGYNFGVKLVERFSSYHRQHHEKSYTRRTLKRWVNEAGGEVCSVKYFGFVPFFCPEILAKAMKAVEFFVERMFIVNWLCCASCLMVVEVKKNMADRGAS